MSVEACLMPLLLALQASDGDWYVSAWRDVCWWRDGGSGHIGSVASTMCVCACVRVCVSVLGYSFCNFSYKI